MSDLQRHEVRLNVAVRAAKVGLWEWDVVRDEVAYSAEWKRQLGYAENELSDEMTTWESRVHPEDLPRVRKEIADYLAAPWPNYDVEFRMRHKDGSWRWILAQADLVCDAQGRPLRMIGSHIDITAHKRAELELARANRALRMLSDSNQSVIRAQTEAELLNEVCRIAVEVGGYRMAWVGLAEPGAGKTVRPVAHRGPPAPYLASGAPTSTEGEWGAAPAAQAIRSGRPHIVRDLATAPDFQPWREAALRLGYRSAVALPLIADGRTLGAFSIYAPEADAFDEREMAILDELAGDIAFGLTTLQMRAERARAEERLHKSEQEFRAFVENSPDFIIRYDREFRVTYVNPALCQLMGLPADAFLNKPVGTASREASRVTNTAGVADIHRAIDAVVATGEANELEVSWPLPGGTRMIHVRYFPERDRSGAVVSVLSIGRDITARRQAEDALKGVLRHARTTVMHADVVAPAGWRTRDEAWAAAQFRWTARFDDEAAAQAVLPLALTPGETYYDGWVRAKHPEDTPAMGLVAARAFLLGATTWEQEFRATDRDGRVHWFAQVAAITAVGDGGWHVTTINTDITARRCAEEAVLAREREFRTLAEHTPDHIARYDREHRALYVNRALETRGDVSPPEALHRMIDGAFATAKPVEADVATQLSDREAIMNVRMVPEVDETGRVISVLATTRDVTALKHAEQERQMHLRFLENMDKVNRAIQGANDLEQMMHDVLDVVLGIFGCDRAWLVYPCDPDAAEWWVPMERTRPEYPGALAAGVKFPMDAEVAGVIRTMLAADGPVTFGPQAAQPVPASARAFQVQSFVASVVHPKIEQPYMFGLHQCSFARIWTPAETMLFREIGRRLADALTSLLTVRSLRENERRMEEAQHITHVGDWDSDLVTGRLRWSDETRRIFELAPQDPVPTFEQLQERIHPDDLPLVRQRLAGTLERGTHYDIECRINRPGGGVRILHVQGDVQRDEGGQPRRLFGTIQDITERRRTQEALALFRSLIDHTNVAIEVIDPATSRFLDVNDTTCRMHGYTREEFLALSVVDIDPAVTAANWPPFIAAMRQDGYRLLQAEHRRKDGSVFPVEIAATYIRLDCDYLLSVAHDITERRRAEDALRESQVRLELANRATRIGPWDWNLLTNEVHFSTEWKRQLGYEEHEVASTYTEWESRLHPDDRDRVFALLRAYHAGEIPDYEVEFRLRHKDGSYRWIFTRGEVLRNAAGQPIRMIGCHVDITARKEAQDELRRSQQAYAALVNTVDGIVWEVDVSTFRFTFVSQQAERLLGYPVARWTGEQTFWHDHVHPDDQAWTMEYCVQATAAKRDHDFRYRMLAADGRIVWLHDIVTVVIEHDRPVKLRGIMVDITETKAAEEALRWRTALFEAQVDAGLDGILVVDAHGKKILQNQRMAEVWKIPPHIADDPDDRRQVAFVTERTKHPQAFIAKVNHLYAHPNEVSRDEIELVDGTVLDRYSAPVRDKTGRHYGRIWSFRDITATKQLEEQFRQSQKMEAVGQLAGGIAHDFNNLLTVVQMQSSLILGNRRMEPATEQGVRQIMEAATRAANLTRQLLTFSRQSVKQARALDLADTLGSTTKLLRRVVGEHITVQTRFAPALPLVQADAGMMEQVLMNLVINARDAMPDGGRLTLALEAVTLDAANATTHRSGREGRFVRLMVEDTGGGIPPENVPRIFDPFFTTKEVGKGTGLGLATVFGIVQQHHGWIEVASELGRGTTFLVFLPALAGLPAPAPSSTPAAAVSIRGGTETVLLVEDEPVVRALAATSLQRHGYRVIEAGSAAEAIRCWEAQQGRIDLLMTDLIMPGGVSGQQLAEELRSRHAALRVIYTSGYNNENVTLQLRLEPGRNFLPKPYPVGDLLAIVRRRLDEK